MPIPNSSYLLGLLIILVAPLLVGTPLLGQLVPVVELVELPNHRVIKTLEDNQPLQERMKNSPALPTEFVQLDIGDGITVDASVTKPKNFQPTQGGQPSEFISPVQNQT